MNHWSTILLFLHLERLTNHSGSSCSQSQGTFTHPGINGMKEKQIDTVTRRVRVAVRRSNEIWVMWSCRSHAHSPRQTKQICSEEIEDSWSLAQLSSKENNLCKISFFLCMQCFLKGQYTQKFKLYWYLSTLMSFQTWMIFFCHQYLQNIYFKRMSCI